MKLKKLVAAGLAAVMVVSLAACGGSDSTSSDSSTQAAASLNDNTVNSDAANTQQSDETLNVALDSEPATIVYQFIDGGSSENNSCIIEGAIMDTLVKTDDDGNLVANLATEWEWLDEYRVEFTLRDDVTMTDGHTMTADDVLYTFKTLAELGASGDQGRYLDESLMEVVDDTHVIIGFNTVSPDLLSMLSWTPFGIFSESEVEAAGGLEAASNAPLVGSGRYKFKEWVSGQYITLERNDNYWDTDYTGYYKEIKITFVSDPAAREASVQAGDVQVTTTDDVATAATYNGTDGVKVTFYEFGQVYHLWFNMAAASDAQDYEGNNISDVKAGGMNPEAMANADVRKAIDLALDYDAIASYATAGQEGASLGYIESDVAFASDYYTTEERAQDIDQAKQLLADAGYGDGLELSCVGTSDTTNIYTIIQGQLAQVGITLDINTVDVATFVQDSNGGNYDLILVGEYLDTRNPSAFTFFRQANINAFCIGGDKYTTPEIETLIDNIIQAETNDDAAPYIEELMQTFKDNTLVLNLCPQLKSVITADNIKGVSTRERGYIDITTFYAE